MEIDEDDESTGRDSKRGRPALNIKPVMVRLHPHQIEELDRQKGEASRADYIRKLIDIGLYHPTKAPGGAVEVGDRYVNNRGGITWRLADGAYRHMYINPVTGETRYALSLDPEPDEITW